MKLLIYTSSDPYYKKNFKNYFDPIYKKKVYLLFKILF